MKDIQLNILLVIAAVMLVITGFLYSGMSCGGDSFVAGKRLLVGFDVSKIASITIMHQDDVTTIIRNSSGYVVSEKYNYPVSSGKLNDLIFNITDIRLAEKISNNVESFDALGLSEDSKDATHIRFTDDEGNTLAALVIGNAASGASGSYVRLEDSETAYSSSGQIRVQTKPEDYLDTELFKDFDIEQIQKVAVNIDKDDYSIERSDDGEIVLVATLGNRLPDDAEYEDVFEALEDLEFDDVSPASEIDLQFDGRYTCELKNGLVYKISSAVNGEDFFISVSAVSPLDNRQLTITQQETEEEMKEKEALVVAHESAEAFNASHQGWIYKISSYDGENLRRPLEELFEEPEE